MKDGGKNYSSLYKGRKGYLEYTKKQKESSFDKRRAYLASEMERHQKLGGNHHNDQYRIARDKLRNLDAAEAKYKLENPNYKTFQERKEGHEKAREQDNPIKDLFNQDSKPKNYVQKFNDKYKPNNLYQGKANRGTNSKVVPTKENDISERENFQIEKVESKKFEGPLELSYDKADVNPLNYEEKLKEKADAENNNNNSTGTQSLYQKPQKDPYLAGLDKSVKYGNAVDLIAAGVNINDMKHNRDQEFNYDVPLVSRSHAKVNAPDIRNNLYNKVDQNLAKGIRVARETGSPIAIAGMVGDANSKALDIENKQGQLNLQANGQTIAGERQDKQFVEGMNNRILTDKDDKRRLFEREKAAYDKAGKQSLYGFANNIGLRDMNKNVQTNKYLQNKELANNENFKEIVKLMMGGN